MSYKAILADDSLTIQKVIKITLAHEPFELTICQSEDQLKEKISKINPDLIFLDFSLSENKSGYQLCSDLKKVSPNSKVLMLYGTFDNVDEVALKNCGASDKIIKPFDSVKFIDLCKKIVGSELVEGQEEDLFQEEHVKVSDENENENAWVVKEETTSSETPRPTQSLKVEMEDWGAPVPGVIIEEGSEKNLEHVGAIPSVIETLVQKVSTIVEDAEMILPASDDLEYPDLTVGPSVTEPKVEIAKPKEKSLPSLQSLDMFNEIEDEDQPISLEEVLGTNTVEEVKKIEEVISDEIQDDDLWQADEVFDAQPVVVEKIASEAKESIVQENIHLSPNVEKHEQASIVHSGSDELFERIYSKIKEDLDQKIKYLVSKAVEDACKESVDSIAWEVIPDLAENIIKSEISKIANSVMED